MAQTTICNKTEPSPSALSALRTATILCLLLVGSSLGWSPSPTATRSVFLSSAATALLSPAIAVAASVDEKKSGTKEDPVFQACLSKCIYECTKPKGDEQKSRSECRTECKTTCATTKQQLGLGNKPL